MRGHIQQDIKVKLFVAHSAVKIKLWSTNHLEYPEERKSKERSGSPADATNRLTNRLASQRSFGTRVKLRLTCSAVKVKLLAQNGPIQHQTLVSNKIKLR